MKPASTPKWSELDAQARGFRVGHAALAVVELACLGYLWSCALARRRDPLLAAALIVLAVEGVGLVIGRGSCPLGPFQRRLGDPVPLFQLVLPPRAAKAAMPILAAVAAAGVVALGWRTRGR